MVASSSVVFLFIAHSSTVDAVLCVLIYGPCGSSTGPELCLQMTTVDTTGSGYNIPRVTEGHRVQSYPGRGAGSSLPVVERAAARRWAG